MLVYTGCEKEDLDCDHQENQEGQDDNSQQEGSFRSYHDGSDDGSGIFTDRDKCKKCHTGRTMDINWTAPYMSDNRYESIRELINDYDFENNVHTLTNQPLKGGVTSNQKEALINYLSQLTSDMN